MEYFHKKERIQVRFDVYVFIFKKLKWKLRQKQETETEVGAHLESQGP